jgi:2-keto-3-deoxy-L-rhamnonate aldolase RhmA
MYLHHSPLVVAYWALFASMATTSSLRQRLLQGVKSYGPMVLSDSPVAAEILATIGYGHILVDHEHSPTDIRSGQALLQAIQSAATNSANMNHNGVVVPPTEPIVRLPSHDPAYMKKVLDSMRLPGGVLVPMIDDAATAQAVVNSARYPRQKDATSSATSTGNGGGIRGCAVPFIRGSSWGMNPEYMRQCEEDLLVMVQVESPKGVQAISEIAAIEGIDAIFLGPMDLSCSIGKMGLFNDPEVIELIGAAEEAVRDSGCLLAGFRSPGRDLKDMFDAGYSLVCGSVDVGLLRDAARQDFDAASAAISSATK